jgi:gliding motility-associated-like protein
MFNNRSVAITILLGLFLLSIGDVFGQPPVITPKSNIVLKLDGTGNYTVVLSDVATVTGAGASSASITLSPLKFNCNSIGPQTITVKAVTQPSGPLYPSAVSFFYPYGIVIDADNNIFFTDAGNERIRKISADGIVTTVAGTGNFGWVDGPGNVAKFWSPTALAIDVAGNLYVSDSQNNRIRKVAPDGTVSTIAGNGSAGAVNGIGTSASFNSPYGIAIDKSGNIYVAEYGNNDVRKITPLGMVSTLAGNVISGDKNGPGLSARFLAPYGITVDNQGNIYVSDAGNNKIKKITPDGFVSTVAGNGVAASVDGPAVSAEFRLPDGLLVDPEGNIIVTDLNGSIRKISTSGIVSTLAGPGQYYTNTDGPANQASFSVPIALAYDTFGNLFVTDINNIRKITPSGIVSTYAGSGDLSFKDGDIGVFGSSTVSAQIPVTVISDPIFDPIPDITLIADANCQAKLPDYTITAKVSPCSNMLKITQTPVAGTFVDNASPQVIKLTAEDGFGGIGSVWFNVKVVSKPVITAKQGPIVLQLDASGKYVAKLADVADVSACEAPQIQLNPVVFDCSSIGQQMITVTAGDGQPNSTTTLEIPVTIKAPLAISVPSVKIDPDFYGSCDGTSLTYTAIAQGAGNNPTYQWKVNGLDAGENTFTFTSSTLKTGDEITCTITTSAACSVATATSNVASLTADPTVTNAVTIKSSAINNIASPNKQVTFTATAAYSKDVAYQWQVNNINTGNDSPVFITDNLVNGDVVTCLVSTFGKCIATPYVTSNAITMIVATPIVIVNTFTPNNDGVNDTWDIPSLAAYPACLVKVFNRYGAIVYSSVGYTKAWDGTYNGKQVPVGVYYYIIDFKDDKSKISGSVTVLR